MNARLNTEQQKVVEELQAFVSKRNRVSMILLTIILICYYLFVIGVGAFRDILGIQIGNTYITIGIYSGIAIIFLCFITTGIYTYVANKYFDKWQNKVLKKIDSSNLLEIYPNKSYEEDIK